MGLFRYEAVDKSGKVVRGVMDAANEQQVAQKLGAMGYNARNVINTNQRTAAQPATATQTRTMAQPAQPPPGTVRGKGMQSVTLASGVPVSIKSSVSASSLAMFFRQLATLVKSGQPLYQSSTDLRVSNSKIRAVIPVIQEKIKSGQKLSGAMAEFPGLFPVHAIASVWCSELSGKLDIVLEELATDFEQEAKDTLLGRIGWGITKILILGFLLILPFLDFNSLLSKVAGKGIPAVVDAFKDGMKSAIPLILAVIAFWIIWGFIKRVPMVRHTLDTMLLKVPIWGRVHRYNAMARFFHMMDSMISAGLSPAAAWEAASLTPRNSAIAGRLKQARVESPVDSGTVSMLERAMVFEMDDIGMVAVGEKSGSLPEAMANIAQSYKSRANAQKTIGRVWAITLILVLNGVLTVGAVYMMATGYRTYLEALLKEIGI